MTSPFMPRRAGVVARFWFACLASLAVLIVAGAPAAAHPSLESASPAPDGLLATPPEEIELWFTERVDDGAGSPSIEIVDAQGNRTPADARIDPDDPRHVIATTDAISTGTFTIDWSVRSLDDGHTLTGSYAFRVGGSDRAPGAATTEGERPQAWNVITRWLTFLGAALAAGSALLLLIAHAGLIRRRAGSADEQPSLPHLRLPLALGGAMAAALATLAEPFLQTQFPPAGASAPSLGDAFNSQPDAWLYRLVALVAASLLATIALLMPRLTWASVAAGIAALGGVIGLSMTGHAAGEERWRNAAITVDAVHQITIALWIGGLILLAVCWRTINRAMVARFSLVALPLLLIGIGAGVGNSIFALPTLSALWESDYGKVIIVKLIVLSFVLELALFHRLALRQAADRAAELFRKMRVPLRIEAALALVVVLGGSVLALLAPASVAETHLLSRLEITHYSESADGQERLQTTLYVSPAKPGANEIGVGVSDHAGTPIPPEQIQRVTLDFESLTNQTEQLDIEAIPGADGIWRAEGMQLSIADWWRVTVTVRRAGVADSVSPYYVLLPDPNLSGFPGASDENNPEAEAIFQRGLAGLTSLQSVSFVQQLSSGTADTLVFSQTLVNDGSDGTTPAMSVSTETTTVVTIGTTRWIGQEGGRWGETGSNLPVPPAEWGQDYAAATNFRLGGTEEVNGEQAQIITFYTPETALAPAYYVWWVGVDSGRVLQVAMVSRLHYMSETFSDFNAPIEITPPVNAEGTPLAEPGLDLTTIGGATPVPGD